ncbi:hypothetical protein ACIP9H_29450 [Streptomyces sp. NPDC088732]|uniref:hypothetical protein n=1 Tax=Streptomyces sp. NPDC088732 TaxID=3365879 RepID=UPI0037F92874
MSDLAPDVRDLIEAAVEALTVPRPAETRDLDTFVDLVRTRAADVRIQLSSLLRSPELFTLAERAERLREWTADNPATYTVQQDGGQG